MQQPKKWGDYAPFNSSASNYLELIASPQDQFQDTPYKLHYAAAISAEAQKIHDYAYAKELYAYVKELYAYVKETVRVS